MIKGQKDSTKYKRFYYEERTCKWCKEKFYVVRKNRAKHKRPGFVKSRNTVNCSKRCSFEYRKRGKNILGKKYREERRKEKNVVH